MSTLSMIEIQQIPNISNKINIILDHSVIVVANAVEAKGQRARGGGHRAQIPLQAVAARIHHFKSAIDLRSGQAGTARPHESACLTVGTDRK
jgi:hypothetical protein